MSIDDGSNHDDAWWRKPLADTFRGRDAIIVGDVPAAWNDHVSHLTAAGTNRIMIVATHGRGVGNGPDVPTVVVEPPAGLDLMQRIRHGNALIGDPPANVRAATREFDPAREAIVVGSFLTETAEFDGRPFLAHRRPEWLALEDKTRVDALWDRAGVDHQPTMVVTLAEAERVAATLDIGAGTVWSADAREGWHGGGHLSRWVHDDQSRERALETLAPHCDTVRVMPFIEGVPCSIHGIVLPDGDAVLRPVEMVTLRHDDGLQYGGCATFWDPPGRIRDQMREAARQVAAQLRAEVDFRGTFTIDGVAAADGFWPTELNPRYGAGINVIARSVGDIPILLLHDLAVAGRSVGATADEVERTLVAASDARRGGGTWLIERPTVRTEARAVVFDHGVWRWANDGEPADGEVMSGPNFARCTFDPERTPVGPSVGARAAELWNFVGDELGTGLGELRSAVDPFA